MWLHLQPFLYWNPIVITENHLDDNLTAATNRMSTGNMVKAYQLAMLSEHVNP